MKKYLVVLILIIAIASCSDPGDLEIGFIADLSSGQTILGSQCRNAVLLALEQINESGGILGRKVVLQVRDNGNDPSRHIEIVDELEDRGVQFIIGPFLSQMAASIIAEVEGKDMLLISPVVSSDLYAGKDDNFFVLQPRASSDGRKVGSAVIGRGDQRVALVRSSSNELYTDWFMKGVRDILLENGVTIVYDKTFSSNSEAGRIAGEIAPLSPDGIVFSSLGADAGAIIQQYAKEGGLPHLYGDEWSKNTDLLTYGGKTVESMINVGIFNDHHDKTLVADFFKRYNIVYSHEPIYFTAFAHESVMILKEALERAGDDFTVEAVKEQLMEIDDFVGIMGSLEFDRNGDSNRTKRLYIVKDLNYVPY